jgi:hypothetical protein
MGFTINNWNAHVAPCKKHASVFVVNFCTLHVYSTCHSPFAFIPFHVWLLLGTRVSCIYTIWAYDLQYPTCSYLFGIRVVVFCHHEPWQSFTSVIQLSSIMWTLICTIPTESLDEKLNAPIWPPPWGFLAKIHVLDQSNLNVQFVSSLQDIIIITHFLFILARVNQHPLSTP